MELVDRNWPGISPERAEEMKDIAPSEGLEFNLAAAKRPVLREMKTDTKESSHTSNELELTDLPYQKHNVYVDETHYGRYMMMGVRIAFRVHLNNVAISSSVSKTHRTSRCWTPLFGTRP